MTVQMNTTESGILAGYNTLQYKVHCKTLKCTDVVPMLTFLIPKSLELPSHLVVMPHFIECLGFRLFGEGYESDALRFVAPDGWNFNILRSTA